MVLGKHEFETSSWRVLSDEVFVFVWSCLTAPLTITAGPPLGPANSQPRRVKPSTVRNSTSLRSPTMMMLQLTRSVIVLPSVENFRMRAICMLPGRMKDRFAPLDNH